jgi:uncharacterized protein YicC (UPF0701 family)
MKQLVHRTVSATSAVAHRTAEACSRWPLTLKSNAIRGRMNKQRQHGAVDCALQAARKGLHQRSLSVDSLGSFTGL